MPTNHPTTSLSSIYSSLFAVSAKDFWIRLKNPLSGIVEKYVRCPHTDELIAKYGWEEVKC